MTWKSLALISTSIAALSFSATALASPPPPSQLPTMGYVDVGFTQWWDDYDYSGGTQNYSWTSYTGAARVNMPYSRYTNFQVDLFADGSLDEGPHGMSSGVNVGNVGGALHFNWRDSGEGLLGGFAAVGRVSDAWGWSAPAFMAGLEGQYYCHDWTLGAQAGYMDAGGDYNFLWNGGFVRGTVSYYANPTFKLSGGLAYIAGDSGYSNGGFTYTDSATAWAWSAEGRYRFGRSVPVDFWVRYAGRQEETHDYDTYRLTSNQLYVGFSWAFGGNDLKESDREGASVDTPSFDYFRITSD